MAKVASRLKGGGKNAKVVTNLQQTSNKFVGGNGIRIFFAFLGTGLMEQVCYAVDRTKVSTQLKLDTTKVRHN